MAYQIEQRHQFLTAVQNYLQETYHNPRVEIINLSAPGVTSLHGLYQSYFELEGQKPDLIFLDYSINDQKCPVYRESFESLAVKCLSLPGSPALISFFVKGAEGYTCAPQMSVICRHYGIPFADVGMCLDRDIKEGRLRWQDYSYDDKHPGPFGHGYIGKCLITLLKQLSHADDEPIPYPEKPVFGWDLANLSFWDSSWKYTGSGQGQPLNMTFDFEGHGLYLMYDVGTSSDFGKIHISDLNQDLELFSIDSYRVHEWDRPVQEVQYLSKKPQEYHLNFQILPEDKNKKFHLRHLAFF